MKTIPVSELSGAALDWAVARCEEPYDKRLTVIRREDCIGQSVQRETEPGSYVYEWWAPSRIWAQAGPIIEREDIVILRECDGYGVDSDGFTTSERFKIWRAVREQGGQQSTWFAEYERDVLYYDAHEGHTGTTPLVAAMRCYVASKLGDTVEIPDELMG